MNKLLVTGTMLMLFSTPAFSQASSSGSSLASLLPLIIIAAIWYFYWRQGKKTSKILEQRLVDIENRLEKIEGS